jgi:hypothetical protein
MVNGSEKEGLQKYVEAEAALRKCILPGAPTKQRAEAADLGVLYVQAINAKPAFDKVIREMEKRARAKGVPPKDVAIPDDPKHSLRMAEKKCVRTDEPGSATKVRLQTRQCVL